MNDPRQVVILLSFRICYFKSLSINVNLHRKTKPVNIHLMSKICAFILVFQNLLQIMSLGNEQMWEHAAAAAKSLQSCLTLCDPIDVSPPGSPIPGILQARTREWVAISFSNAWKWKVKVKSLSCVRLLATPWTTAHQALRPWDFPGKSTGVGCHCLLHERTYVLINWVKFVTIHEYLFYGMSSFFYCFYKYFY